MTLAEILWEKNGQRPCVNYPIECRTRPCTVAQGVFCCRECESYKHCLSSCKIKEGTANGRNERNC